MNPEAFVKLGSLLRDPSFFSEEVLLKAYQYNGWFTPENIRLAALGLSKMMQADNFNRWIKSYELNKSPVSEPKTIALIMAGNIPLVGFHDLLCVLISGNKALIKMSSDDAVLLPILLESLNNIDPVAKSKIRFTEGKLEKFDAVIATGSNNSSRYF